ncbi:MAG: NTP transferase domain-containing protein [Candidatus Niyogibacteria bacterium]|nr:NTP transferase domain-containing protein [Candidatus Niyogibacteria bacterium]
MKTIILCGGYGTRMKEETEFKPKPLVEVGGKPILWHIMKIYAHYGFNEFVLALGYKGEMIKDYFMRLKPRVDDFTLDTSKNEIFFHSGTNEDFKVTFAETGLDSLTGERILRVKKYIPENQFMLTYGDGVADIHIGELVRFHTAQRTIGTITGVHPYSKYGLVKVDHEKNRVIAFEQKPLMFDYVSGGFIALERAAFDYFDDGPMEEGLKKLAGKNELAVYKHEGFWKAMDTSREVEELNDLWHHERPWAVWKQKP